MGCTRGAAAPAGAGGAAFSFLTRSRHQVRRQEAECSSAFRLLRWGHVIRAVRITCAARIVCNPNREERFMKLDTFVSKRQSIDTPSGQISYVEKGKGPVALFVHGVLLSGYLWRHQLDAL